MKNALALLTTLLALAACGQKAETAAPSTIAAPAAAPKTREAVAPPKDAPTPSAPAPEKSAPAQVQTSQMAAATPGEIEKDLQPTVEHARAKTKTEKSAARSRADRAEQEMMELTGRK